MTYCQGCFDKQREIDRLKEENKSLKAKLKYQERKEREGPFGSSTPSSKIPFKPTIEKERKPRGARPGHKGAGRKITEVEQVVEEPSEAGSICPDCGNVLEDKGYKERLVIESTPIRAKHILYRLPRNYCPHCKKVFQPHIRGVLPRFLYGNQLIVNALVMHYLNGIPMGRITEQIGIGPGSLVEIFHRLSKLFEKVPERLIKEYRKSFVRHADETGWRTEGKNGYAWLFATENLSIFQFRKTRSGSVARAVFGKRHLPGVLVVDRYAGYNRVPCGIQYCYAHLLREVENLEKEFPDSSEVRVFASTLVPLLALTMGLRNQRISNVEFYKRARALKVDIKRVIDSEAQHLGIRRIQDIFRDNAKRMYHWVRDRRIACENNLSERDLRPTVIARKVSFGSQSDAGAYTRGVLMTVLWTLKKRGLDVSVHLKGVLDELSRDMSRDPYYLLFPRDRP